MLKLKRGVQLAGIGPELVFGLNVCGRVYDRHEKNCLVTSIMDPPHSLTSLHWTGDAADLRSRNLPVDLKQQVVDEIKAALGIDFDVFLENLGEINEHIHIEFQPRRPGTA